MPTVKMTSRFLASISPTSGKQIDYFDAATTGLHLRVSSKGTKTWAYFYRAQTRNGKKQRRFTLGRFPALSLAEARMEAMNRYRQIQFEGADPAAEKIKPLITVTMNDMAGAYILRYAKPNKKSWKEDERYLKRDILPTIGGLHPKDVERRHIEAILDHIADRGATTAQNRVFALMSGLFNWGLGTYVDVPPTFGMKKRVKEKVRERTLTENEIQVIWDALHIRVLGKSGRRITVSDPVSIILKLLLVTGQRSSEVSQARVKEFDLPNRMWTIPPERVKNGRSHRVPLSALAVELIEEALADNGRSQYLFPSRAIDPVSSMPKSAVNPTAANTALNRILKREGLSNITPHDFRETAATGMMVLGCSEHHVAAVLNHARTSVTAKHYARYSFDTEKREALDLWAKHIRSLTDKF